MGSGPVTLDFSNPEKITPPTPAPQPDPASNLRQSVSYAASQNPDQYAKLLTLHKQTGVPPEVAQGNESEVQHAADVNKLDYSTLAVDHPRTTAWASNPDNAAVSGVDEVQRVANVEKNAGVMRSLSAFDWYKGKTLRPLMEYPLTRWALEGVGGAAGLVGGVANFAGLHGDGPDRKNFLQHIEAGLEPEDVGLKSNFLDTVAKQIGPLVISMGTTAATSLAAKTLGLSTNAAKILTGLSIGAMFTADQGGKTYSEMKAQGASDYDARLAANKVAAINAPANALFGATDVVPFLRNNPVGTSLFLGGATGASGQLSQNIVTGQPWYKGMIASSLQGAAMQGGMHIGTEMFFDHLGQVIDAADQSKLKQRSPEAFHDAMSKVFEGDPSLKIPVDQFMEYFHSKGVSAQNVAEQLGAKNYAEALVSGGDVEIPTADFLSKLDAEHQQALFPDIAGPNGLTLRDHEEGRKELESWMAAGGPEKLRAESAQADAETAATPEFIATKEELRNRYIGAGETPDVAETLATKDANVYANLAKQVGMKPDELMKLYDPQVKAEEAPGVAGQMNQDAIPPGGDVIERALNGTVNDIGQLKPEEKKALEKAVRDGVLEKGKGGPYPLKKTVYAAPGYDFEGERNRFVDEQMNFQGSPDNPRGWFRVLPDGSFEIGRTKIGDLSTFVHEPAHGYLQMIGDLAKREDASETLKGDYSKILDYLGAKDGETLSTDQQEKWARANEQYLREGKAPSEGLKGVFQRFAVWLSSIYKKASDLGVELTDDIRGVFDRLYAAEEGVNRAESESGPRLFQSPEEAGWTEEQFKKYAESKGLELDQAKSEILSKLNEAALREKTDTWREEEKNVREAMTAEIDRKPEYLAIRALRKGKLPDGTELTLNREELVKQFGEDRIKALQKLHPGLYRNEGGVDTESAAEMLGFDSAGKMLSVLESTPRRSAAIEEATKQYMTAKHGDIRYDGTLNDQARLAVENEKRAQNLHSELTALRRKVAELKAKDADKKSALRSIEVAPIDAYREAAKQMVESKAIADLMPNRYLDASRKYSREAFDALRKGDVEEAAQAKHKELMNHFLFREATKAREFVEQVERFADKVASPKRQSDIGKAGQDFLSQVQAILGKYRFVDMFKNPSVAQTESLGDFLTRMRDEGQDMPIAPGVINGSGKPYRTLTVSELRDVNAALKMLDHVARNINKITIENRKVDEAKIANGLDQAIVDNVMGGKRKSGARVSDDAEGLADRMKKKLLKVAISPLHAEFLFKRLDGDKPFGPWHDALWNKYNDAQDHLTNLRESIYPELMEIVRGDWSKSLKERIYVKGIDATLAKDDIFSILLNSGNDSNLDKSARGGLRFKVDGAPIPITDEVRQELFSHLSAEDINKANQVLRLIGKLKPEAEKLALKRNGVAPQWIEARPYQTPNGTLEGGYFPLVYDPRWSSPGEKQADANRVDQMFNRYATATTKQGYMIGRTEFAAPLSLDWQTVAMRHLQDVMVDISHWQFATEAQRLLKNPVVKESLISNMGEQYHQNLLDWVRYTVNQDSMGREATDGIDYARRWARSNVGTAVLGFRVMNAAVESAITPLLAMQQAHPVSVYKGMATFMRNPAEAIRFAQESSDYMKNVDVQYDRQLTEMFNDLRGDHSIMGDMKRWAILSRVGIWKIGAVMAWHAGFEDAHRMGLDGKDAIRVADALNRKIQEAGRPGDLSAVERNPYMRELTMFAGPTIIQFNNFMEAAHAIGDRGLNPQTAAKAMTILLAGHLVNSVLFELLRGKGPEDKDKWPAWLLARMSLGLFDGVPVLNQATRYMESKITGEGGGEPRLQPVVQLGKDSVDAITKTLEATQGKTDWSKAAKQDVRTVGEWTGLPTTQGIITGQYIYDRMTGQYQPEHPWSHITDLFYARHHKR